MRPLACTANIKGQMNTWMVFGEHKMWRNGMKILLQLDVLLRRKTICIKLSAQGMQATKTSLEANSVVGQENYNRRGFEKVHFTAYYLSAMSVLTNRSKRFCTAAMLHGRNNRFFFLWEKNVLSNAKHFHCSCHATWLPCKTSFYDNCRNSRALIGCSLTISGQIMNLWFMRCVKEREWTIWQFVVVKDKLTLVFYESVLLLTMNFIITLS